MSFNSRTDSTSSQRATSQPDINKSIVRRQENRHGGRIDLITNTCGLGETTLYRGLIEVYVNHFVNNAMSARARPPHEMNNNHLLYREPVILHCIINTNYYKLFAEFKTPIPQGLESLLLKMLTILLMIFIS